MTIYELLSHRIPASYNGPFWSSYFSLSPLAGGPFSATRFHGTLRNTTASASVVLAGRSQGFYNHILSKLFASEPDAEPLPPLRFFELRRELKRLAQIDDLVISQTGRFLAPRLFGPDFLLLPAWVGHRTQLPSTPELHKLLLNRVDGDLFLIRRNALRCTIDRDPSSLETLFREYCRPTAIKRYGKEVIVLSLPDLRRMLVKGAILWIESPLERIAGIMVEQVDSSLVLRAIGLRDGDYALAKQGALAACYFYSFEYAMAAGITSLDFRGTRPSLTDGVLRYKRKWSASIYDSPDLSFEDMAVHWSHPSPTVHAFFELYAPIFRHCGKLFAASILPERISPGIERRIVVNPGALPVDTASFLKSVPG